LDAPRQQVVAYHEAGHAVVARELGLKVDWIERNADGSGECRIPIPGSVIDEAAVYAAGAMAVWLKFNIQAHPSPDDLQGLHRVPAERQTKAIDRAEKILRNRWVDVEALATRLLNDPDGFVPLPFAPDYMNQ
jgi:hypothetical protein